MFVCRVSRTWVGATLVVGVPLLESLINVLLPVADSSTGVDARSQGGSVLDRHLGGGPGLDDGEADGAGDRADGEEKKRFQLKVSIEDTCIRSDYIGQVH